MHFDIAIIGYGPVGAVAANMFGASGHNIVVIEPKKDIWDIPRAVALDGQTRRAASRTCGSCSSPGVARAQQAGHAKRPQIRK